ncbi:glycoside hydrolase family 76 protein [Apiospora rasikravindrae]|uniref:Glycoside hydrolase family 76 protein n=1 Tax=Apiospora rasikravindrae TaxID=990691 RepID=A0ABR1T0M5_9PEZI
MRSSLFFLAALCLESIAALPQKASSNPISSTQHAKVDTRANTYQDHAEAALDRLQQWYNHDTGLWKSYNPSWWQSANALTTLVDMVQTGSPKAKKVADTVIPNTFQAAGAFNVREGHRLKRAAAAAAEDNKVEEKKNPYSNGYYDDMGWWAMAWIKAYDVTGNKTYLATAEALFADMTTGWGTNCSAGGMWWDKKHTHIDPIADTLFLEVAAWLANRVPADKKSHYADWAVRAWDGFRRSPMYVSGEGEHYVTAGISVKTCRLGKNPHGYTYSNGALVSGLVALSIATGNRDYLQEAHLIAHTIMKIMSKDGVLREPNIDQAHPGQAAPQFKGVFMRGLMRLHAADPRPEYRDFAQRCADSIWDKNRQGDAELGPDWNGPFHGPANASPHSSAMDGIVAAWRMTK